MQLFSSRPAGDAMAVTVWGTASSWTLTALPLFIWMGEILFRTKLSESMFRGLAPWVSRLPGRLLHTNVIGCTIFAAVSGSSAATCATIGKMTLRSGPARYRRRSHRLPGRPARGAADPAVDHHDRLGVTADVPSPACSWPAHPRHRAARLFSATCGGGAANKQKTPCRENVMSFMEKVHECRATDPRRARIGAVLGSIYSGVATATEAAAVGVVGSLALSAVQAR